MTDNLMSLIAELMSLPRHELNLQFIQGLGLPLTAEEAAEIAALDSQAMADRLTEVKASRTLH